MTRYLAKIGWKSVVLGKNEVSLRHDGGQDTFLDESRVVVDYGARLARCGCGSGRWADVVGAGDAR